MRASQRQGGGQPLYLGVHQKGQCQRADYSGTAPPQVGVRVWRQLLCPITQSGRHNSSGQVRQSAQGKCEQSVRQTKNQVWNKIDILDFSSHCQNVIKVFQAQNSTPSLHISSIEKEQLKILIELFLNVVLYSKKSLSI